MKRQSKYEGLQKRKAIAGYLFISPFIVGFLAFMVKPFFQSLYMSLCTVEVSGKGFANHFEGITNLKNQRNVKINEYKTLAKKLMINKMIIELTSKAKSNFDKTQPDLINAQKYLSILTNGKYDKIDLENEQIINSKNSIVKKWNELSRGTKEQLYLALRLGYASNYSKDKTTLEHNGKYDLPVIIDDAFVNFDAERTKNALKCLLDFSKTNQVLYFTCHTDMIKKLLSEINYEESNSINTINIQ